MGAGNDTPDERLIGFYTRGYDEAGRLARAKNVLELVRTRVLLRARLPAPPARVLDVGGGTGAHAAWLAQDGYAVTLVDLVPAHVETAAALDGVEARVGDARALEEADDSVDACLLLGPLYHLPERADRLAALKEAVRVTRPRGLVCAAAISRYAFPMYALRDGAELVPERIAETLRTGRGDPVGVLPDAFSHRPGDLAHELEQAGATDVQVLGIEGPGWGLFSDALPEDRLQALLKKAVKAARLLDDHPETAGASAHLLGVARVP
jgi:SAM-dependent methyltransferase